ncbi:MAG: GNAT family N-acetyltransferase [Firmicutes bacterium]|nr:GNAT family N-acetyltransferase [Bacillota bacterium]
MEIDYPERTEPLKKLWQLAFGDSDAFVDKFFAGAYSPRRCRCVTENGRIAAALYWFDGEFAGQRLAYLYAIATHPDFRNRGLCRELMADTMECLTARGYAGALLMPRNEALRNMYAHMGFRDCCTVSEFACEAGKAVSLREIPTAEYARLRRKYLPAEGVLQEGENLAYLESYARFFVGADFLLAAEGEGECLVGTELLGSVAAAPGILGALGYPRGRFRTPGKDVPGAMFRPLGSSVQAPGYLGLVFD